VIAVGRALADEALDAFENDRTAPPAIEG
jgi:NTE family protein